MTSGRARTPRGGALAGPRRRRSGGKAGGPPAGGAAKGPKGGKAGKGGKAPKSAEKPPAKPKTQEELDREMEEYFMKDSKSAKATLDNGLDDYFKSKDAEKEEGEVEKAG